jgi:GNAT superfamily N-acetyltransferase
MLNAHPRFLILGDEAILAQRTRVAIDSSGTVLGFASYKIAGGVFELEDLFVDPSFWRGGIATALVDDMIAVATQRGFAGIRVTGNAHALPFYESVGFHVEGEVGTVFSPAPRLYRANL